MAVPCSSAGCASGSPRFRRRRQGVPSGSSWGLLLGEWWNSHQNSENSSMILILRGQQNHIYKLLIYKIYIYKIVDTWPEWIMVLSFSVHLVMPTEFLPQIWVTSWTNRDVLKWSISHQSLHVTSCQDFSEKTLQNGGVFKVGPLRLRRLFSCYLVRGGGRQVLSAQSQNSWKNWRKKTSVLLPIEKLLRFSKQIVALLKKRGPACIHSTRSEGTRTVPSWEQSHIPSQR